LKGDLSFPLDFGPDILHDRVITTEPMAHGAKNGHSRHIHYFCSTRWVTPNCVITIPQQEQAVVKGKVHKVNIATFSTPQEGVFHLLAVRLLKMNESN